MDSLVRILVFAPETPGAQTAAEMGNISATGGAIGLSWPRASAPCPLPLAPCPLSPAFLTHPRLVQVVVAEAEVVGDLVVDGLAHLVCEVVFVRVVAHEGTPVQRDAVG